MIAAIVRGGRSASFKSALDYVLHDHDGVGSERVGETQTINLISAPGDAHREMQVTSDAARAIQARARAERGERATASGSRAAKTCFHYALSWHPDDDPTAEEMMRCAHQTLDRLGLSDHQAVIVEHTERPHRHLHVIVSTVHPEIGQANGLYRNAYVLDRWCHQYEKGQSMFRAFKRADKYEPKPEVKPARKPRWEEWKKRSRELYAARQKEADAIRARQRKQLDMHEDRVVAIRKQADEERQAARERHRKEINDYWAKRSPKPKLDPRPASPRMFLTAGEELGKAIKSLSHRHPTSGRAPPPGSPEVRPAITSTFARKTENSLDNHLAARGITNRHEGAVTFKRWQRQEMDGIQRRMRDAIELLRVERDMQKVRERWEWDDHRAEHERLREEARRQLDIPDPNQPEQLVEPEIEIDQYGSETIDISGPFEPEDPPYEAPPLEPDDLVPDPYPDFEIGD